jgi:broad specificity phosphatase PhoE
MKKVTLIRHGQSKFNAGEYKSDSELRDCGLTDLGINQAKSLNYVFDTLVISTLKRAKQTFDNSNIKSNNILYNDLVREQRETGELNYLVGEEINPENPDQMRQRVREAINFIKNLPGENIGIISHAFFIWYFLEQIGQQPQIIQNGQSISGLFF